MSQSFQKKKEDFVCENCGCKVKGDGYTNHCPKCLFSKHVDVKPGDRQNPCGGLMQPVGLEMEKGEYIITHQCTVCGQQRKNKSAAGDDFSALLGLARDIAKKLQF